MGERNTRLINDIVGGWHKTWLCRHYGLSEKELQSFKDRNQSEIVFRKLKRNFNKHNIKPFKKQRAGPLIPSSTTVSADSEGTRVTIK